MDERILKFKSGIIIPAWDLAHRLPITGKVGPDVRDDGTIYRINSIFMDVSDQPNMARQDIAFMATACMTIAAYCFYIVLDVLFTPRNFDLADIIFLTVNALSSIGFGIFSIILGRNEFFSLKRRPIRFNRIEKKIYTIRQRRFRNWLTKGDVAWQIPWDDDAIFCIHRGNNDFSDRYHIRYYQCNKNGLVERAFSIGKTWEGKESIEELLAQWNYLCIYMNSGPADLPLPLLFLSEEENFTESFLYCMYEAGFQSSVAFRIRYMPIFLLMGCMRFLSLLTCRNHRWPETALKTHRTGGNDLYDQPSGQTPIGWGATSLARRAKLYPCSPMSKSENWYGTQNAEENAALWARDLPPTIKARA